MIYAPRRAALRSEMDSKLRAGELSAMRAIINGRYRENLLRALLARSKLVSTCRRSRGSLSSVDYV